VGVTGRLRLGAALVGLLLGTCTPPPPREPAPGRTFARVPIGLCEDYPEETRSLEEVRRDLELMRRAGLRVLRVSIGWDGVEAEQNQYDLAFWDAFVELAVTELGITLVPYVAYTPRWNATSEQEDFWRTPPRDPSELGELLALLAARYEGRIHSWEIWNEPDNRDYWLGSAEQYAALLEAGSRAVRAANPAAQVVLGGLAGNVDFLRELFDEHGAAALVDVVNLHSYYETWNPNPVETIGAYVDDVSEIVSRHGGRQALWMAEVGYSNHVAPDASAARYDYEHGLDFQAVMVMRTLGLALSKPALSLIAWYELKDPRPSAAVIGDDHNRHLGVAFADYRPKPAFEALAFASRLSAGGLRSVDAALRVREPDPADLQLHGWLTPDGTLLLMAWLETHPEHGPPAPTPAARDERLRQVEVSAPYAPRGEVDAFDALGRKRAERPSLRHGPRGLDLTLELRGGDILIVQVPVQIDP
jgi:glycosyl hydrolase family 39 (putative alpha-L-iduronidase)